MAGTKLSLCLSSSGETGRWDSGATRCAAAVKSLGKAGNPKDIPGQAVSCRASGSDPLQQHLLALTWGARAVLSAAAAPLLRLRALPEGLQ